MSLITIDPGEKDIKNVGGNIFATIVIGLIGFAAYVYLLPFLNSIVWGTIELMVGIFVGAVLLYFLTERRTWSALRYTCNALSEVFLSWAINLNPFDVIEFKIENTEKSLEKILECGSVAKGKKDEIEQKLNVNDKELKSALNQIEIQKARPNKTESDYDLIEDNMSLLQMSKDYADSMVPIYNDLTEVVNFSEKSYKTAKRELELAKKAVKKQRDVYETVVAAQNLISNVWKALNGDTNLNKDAEKAVELLRKDISLRIGKVQNGIKIANQFVNSKDLENAAKVRQTLVDLKNFDNTIAYSDTINAEASRLNLGVKTPTRNEYIDYINL